MGSFEKSEFFMVSKRGIVSIRKDNFSKGFQQPQQEVNLAAVVLDNKIVPYIVGYDPYEEKEYES